MNIIFFSIFFYRLRIFSRHRPKCRFYAAFGQLLRESGQLNVGTVTGRGRELGGYEGKVKGWSVVCVRD